MDFRKELGQRYLILDGSMGALLQGRGLPAGMAPDVWMMENESVIRGAHQEYVDAGADIILTNTFGASKWRLAEYDVGNQVYEINAKAVEIARSAAGSRAFVAGDIGPSGETIFPTGKRSFDEAFDVFHEQAKALVKLGVDLIVVETIFDSLELRAALSAVREASTSIPLLAFSTFNTDGITDTGATPENCAAIAEGFNADAVGVNCSTGPDSMLNVVKRLSDLSSISVGVQPNAGLPVVRGGKTVFPLNADQLEPFVEKFVEMGATIIGGCCGTTPEYIRRVAKILKNRSKPARARKPGVLVSSLAQSLRLGGSEPFLPIGERMNPSGRKKLSESLKAGDLSLLLDDARLQTEAGGKMLDLNVGVPLVDEPALMKTAVVAVQNQYPKTPLMLDSSNTHALKLGSEVYYGRPLLNSINAEEEKLVEMIPVVKRSGGSVVALMTGIDVPVKAVDRCENAKKIVARLRKEGIDESRLVFDCLGLVVSAMQEGSKETLNAISWVKEHFPNSATTLGLSNVSFGLPNRGLVHSAFLCAAVQRGLDSAIMSVTDPIAKTLAASAQMWGPKAGSIQHFVQNYAAPVALGNGVASASTGSSQKNDEAATPDWVLALPREEKEIFEAIVDGNEGAVSRLVQGLIDSKIAKSPSAAMILFLEVMTPAIRRLGDLFAKRVKFIPHLIAAADAMKAGVALLEPYLIQARQAASGKAKGTVIFATVKGDIHDIGKNICILMLRNFGFEVIDLGRNVDPELILKTAIEKNASVIALSALMTTTMTQMKVVIDAVKSRQLPFKVVIGGAVVTPDFAREIQADGYSTDVGTVVSEIEKVIALLQALDS